MERSDRNWRLFRNLLLVLAIASSSLIIVWVILFAKNLGDEGCDAACLGDIADQFSILSFAVIVVSAVAGVIAVSSVAMQIGRGLTAWIILLLATVPMQFALMSYLSEQAQTDRLYAEFNTASRTGPSSGPVAGSRNTSTAGRNNISFEDAPSDRFTFALAPDEVKVYRFSKASDLFAIIDVFDDSGGSLSQIDPVIQLLKSNDNRPIDSIQRLASATQVASADDGGKYGFGAQIVRSITGGEQYALRIDRSGFGDSGPNSNRLTVSIGAFEPAILTANADPTLRHLDSDVGGHWYELKIEDAARQCITVKTTMRNTVTDTILEVYDHAGETGIERNDDSPLPNAGYGSAVAFAGADQTFLIKVLALAAGPYAIEVNMRAAIDSTSQCTLQPTTSAEDAAAVLPETDSGRETNRSPGD